MKKLITTLMVLPAMGVMASNIDFNALDTNSDGVLTKQEAAASTELSRHFDKIDTNGDGRLKKSEVEAYLNS